MTYTQWVWCDLKYGGRNHSGWVWFTGKVSLCVFLIQDPAFPTSSGSGSESLLSVQSYGQDRGFLLSIKTQWSADSRILIGG